MAGLRVAVAGATGLVGRTILQALEHNPLIPVSNLVALASERTAGTHIDFQGEQVEVRRLKEDSFRGCDLAFFSAGAAVSRRFAPIAAPHARWVIDNSSAFRMEPAIPLVVPEVNAQALRSYRGIIANPNCSTIQMVVALAPLHLRYGLESVVVSTYQSVSGSGAKGIRALDQEIVTGVQSPDSPYPHPIALNVLPHIDTFDSDGWSGEEHKMIVETRKIMSLPDLHVVPTTARVPVRIGHSESIYARFSERVDVADARELLKSADGIIVRDEPGEDVYPLAREAAGSDGVFVGRIRQIPGDDHALALWVVADNVRKGAATNATRIAELALANSKEVKPAHV
ncbi:MAG: aspartate-semialdehyde dehydrogenase [Chloroflexota bacterium]|nr:MAG: aspartate-semialdehyde dehydrogenase [Chloroflexota bacterium]